MFSFTRIRFASHLTCLLSLLAASLIATRVQTTLGLQDIDQ